MIKVFFKWVFKIIGSLILLIILTYGAFHLWEYSTGSKYVKYLTENSETLPLDKNFTYHIIDNDIKENKLILVGEIHGFKEPGKFDVDFFKYLHKNHHVKHYIAEMDFSQASFLNTYLESGNEDFLIKSLKKWAVVQGRNNLDYFNKYKELASYYQQLPEKDKFKIIGIDQIQDAELLEEYLDLLETKTDSENIEVIDEKDISKKINRLKIIHSNSLDTMFVLNHIQSNLDYIENKIGRENIMFQNFEKLYKKYGLQERKVYGYFGLYHVFQYRINGNNPLASKIRQSDLGLENNMLSINIMMNDSYMVMPSNALPEFMREAGPYTQLPVSADNMLIMYLVGIKDFKRMTPEHEKSLIKMNGKDNPYSNSIRMNKTIQLLPVTEVMEMDDKGKPYVQYTLFIRNSEWAEPMVN